MGGIGSFCIFLYFISVIFLKYILVKKFVYFFFSVNYKSVNFLKVFKGFDFDLFAYLVYNCNILNMLKASDRFIFIG